MYYFTTTTCHLVCLLLLLKRLCQQFYYHIDIGVQMLIQRVQARGDHYIKTGERHHCKWADFVRAGVSSIKPDSPPELSGSCIT